ncbi:uncharacterized protein FIBRA_00510 [Fibroporia radiculosa]|uniref:CP-type G domain-containing protein n=1 Tax=Fibroporia radiculosa TaxID=599839 RepID=J4I7Z3_9APHY|nr:uncharacterized protein FIBRA_00510 [Fibroporia radiculosa]CCL98511.1 predicted protein [Fibroporia radiculosa]
MVRGAPTKTRNPNPSGLGRAIINKKVKDAHRARETGLYTTDIDPTSRLQSITQERDLDEFLNTAQLAGTQFTAERRNVKILNSSSGVHHNSYLLSEEEERHTIQRHQENRRRLRVPRRSPWTKKMTATQLDRQEKDAFLEWRRGLAELQEQDRFLLTPFERNLEVWRQLWRVLERSHLVVQIVDARNPLRFRCEDLEFYVQDVEGAEGEQGTGKGLRRNMLLINKSDLLTAKQRRVWADYFDEQGVRYAFFSAANAAALQLARQGEPLVVDAPSVYDRDQDEGYTSSSSDGEMSPENNDNPPTCSSDEQLQSEESDVGSAFSLEEDTPDTQDPRTKVLSVLELEDLFVKAAPDLTTFTDSTGAHPGKLVVGLVGYPNVGKSSTINALLGEKKVSVSSTPGKTKHFQTINLSPTLMLCDCPGLVFPQFTTTRADLVCDGVLPIDQLREHTGPIALVAKRIPREVLEATYGLAIKTRGPDDDWDGGVAPEDLLIPYAIARGFMRSGQGNPDEARAARYILKDYVNAKLLFCHPPPGVSEEEFNEQTRELSLKRVLGKKRAPLTRVVKGADTFIAQGNIPPMLGSGAAPPSSSSGPIPSTKSHNIDEEFFTNDSVVALRPRVRGSARGGQEVTRMQIYPHQNAIADDGSPVTENQARIAAVLTNAGGGMVSAGKKHHKKPKRVKQRSGRGYD